MAKVSILIPTRGDDYQVKPGVTVLARMLDDMPLRGEDETYIYGLIDPRDGQLRYVGKANDPEHRLYMHMAEKYRCHRTAWIAGLKSNGLAPELCIIAVVADTEWEAQERYYIAYYRGLGCDLVNGTDGGDGLHNPTAEVRQKISKANKGRIHIHSPETLRKLSDAMKGRGPAIGHPVSQETRDKIGNFHRGRKRSPETVARIVQANKNRPPLSDEARRNYSEAAKKAWEARKCQK